MAMNAVTDIPVLTSLFGHVNLGYLLAESQRLDEWRRFARDGLGVHADEPQAGVLALRIDRHARRIIVRRGPAEDVIALGWQLDSEQALQLALDRLQARGIPVQEGSGDAAASRGVERFWGFDGPKRLRIELFTQPVCSEAPLDMQASGFVTGAQGMGHFAISTREPEAMLKFFQDVFDARISDYIDDRFNGIDLDLAFLRLNARHHSIAVAATRGKRMDPLRTRIHHLNLQCKCLDDVTQAYRRMRDLGFVIANGIGQHPNDRELSFYVASPSGFEIELGWNPIEVTDEASWQPVRYRGTSLWGHFPEGLTLGAKLGQMRRGLMSLTRKEYTVEAKR
jgi:2,3-dihydroxybiphenyl 1,2-dioxygenase